MNRRRLLLSIVNTEKYLDVIFSGVYFNLISSTRDSGKIKLAEIEGNGVIENQLINPTLATQNSNGITITNNGDGSFTLTGIASAATYFTFIYSTWDTHYYLFKGINYANNDVRWYDSYYGSYSSNKDFIFKQTNSAYTQMRISVRIDSGVNLSTPFTFYPQLIDLTLMFGAGNEPTTLADNRIQAILNGNYIKYNLGEYKASKVAEIEMGSLPNGYQRVEYIGSSGAYIYTGVTITSNTKLKTKVSFDVLGGGANENNICSNGSYGSNKFLLLTSSTNLFFFASGAVVQPDLVTDKDYEIELTKSSATVNGSSISFSNPDSSSGTLYLMYAGVDHIFHGKMYYCDIYDGNTLVRSFVPCYRLSDNEIGFYDVVNKVFYANDGSGTFTKGSNVLSTKITLPKVVELGGAISAHNTFEITKTDYVFTRNIGMVDLGSLSYQYKSDNPSNLRFISTTLSTMDKLSKPIQPDLLCKKYTSVSGYYFDNNGTVDKIIRIDDDLGRFVIRDLAYTDGTTFKTALSGIYAYYPLSLAQVTTISRKRLKAVDLGTLTYTYEDGVFKVQISDMITGNPGINKTFINEYLFELITTLSNMGDRHYARNSNWLYIKDTRYNNATNFKNAVSGITLWYETSADVADFTDKAKYENGGTITTNEFSWVENQNAKALNTNNTWYTQGTYGALSNITERSALYTRNTTDTTLNIAILYQGSAAYSTISGHKYFIRAKFTPSSAFDVIGYVGVYGSGMTLTANTKNDYYEIISNTTPAYIQFIIAHNNPLALGGTCLIEDVECIDLTLAFGSGNEPTSINDYRIQDIINMGYIPTNTDGTQKSVNTQVLCDLTMKVQE